MKVNLKTLMPDYKGFIIEITNGKCGKNYVFDSEKEIKNGDMFWYSDYQTNRYALVLIENYKAKVLITENGFEHKISDYLTNLDTLERR